MPVRFSNDAITEYDELLSTQAFIKCHQSYLVNTLFVKSWIKTGGDRLIMETGHETPVSGNSREKVNRAIGAN